MSAIIPRLCRSAFSFCQPFLLTATLNFIASPSMPETKYYGNALVGAYVLVYLGMAVYASFSSGIQIYNVSGLSDTPDEST